MLSILTALLIGAASALLTSYGLSSAATGSPLPGAGQPRVSTLARLFQRLGAWRGAWASRQADLALRQDLPGTLDLLGSALRAGQSLEQALSSAGREAPASCRSLFSRVSSRLGLGERPESALRLECEALLLPDLRSDLSLLCTVVSVARSTGANLAELLDQCSATLRERERLRAEARALTAQGRLSGLIVALLPIFLLLAMSLIDPELTRPMFTTPMGWGLLALGACLDACGFWLIRRISKVEL